MSRNRSRPTTTTTAAAAAASTTRSPPPSLQQQQQQQQPQPQPQQPSNSNSSSSRGIDIVPSSIEQSLQDWLSRSISDNSPILDTKCGCCGQIDCEIFEALGNTVKKLEGDARLAAEIGQSLLHKHESYILESKQVKADLEQQLDEAREKAQQLEQLLEDADCTRRELLDEHSKTSWESQKTQKTLRETAADLEVANARCTQLMNELKAETMEVDKLRIFKFMVRQADVREENLRAKLEDTKQELAVSRKTELTLESKHRKLKSRYETVCSAYERLKLNQQEFGHGCGPDNLTWLRESNEKLRKDVLKLTTKSLTAFTMTTTTESPTDLQQQQQSNHNNNNNPQQQFITLIKELASANNKLKTDLLECRELLSETRHEVITLNCRIEDLEKDNSNNSSGDERLLQHQYPWPNSTGGGGRHERVLSTSAPQDDSLMKWPPTIAPSSSTSSSRRLSQQQQQKQKGGPIKSLRTRRATSSLITPPKDLPTIAPSPTASTSTPTQTTTPAASIVHHHYHYHMQHQQPQHPLHQQEKSAMVPPPQSSYDSISQNEDDTLAPLQDTPLPRKIADNINLQKHIKESKTDKLSLPPPTMKNSVSFSSQATSTISSTGAGDLDLEDDGRQHQELEEEEEVEEGGSPYHQLKHHVAQALQRLRATDIRALNRRLKRAFDILELSAMSNSIIENILVDVDALRTRFTWIEQQQGLGDKQPLQHHQQQSSDELLSSSPSSLLISWQHDGSMQEFFPMLQIMQDMLQEIGQLRSTMNDLQVEYVKKVEENDIRAEQEVIRKREIRRRTSTLTSSNHPSNQPPTIVTWLTNVFFQPSSSSNTRQQQPQHIMDDNKTLVRSVSHDSIMEQKNNHPTKPNSSTTTSKAILRHKKSDIDRHGPPSSYPRVSTEKRMATANKSMSTNNLMTTSHHHSTGGSSINTSGSNSTSHHSTSQPRPIPYPKLRASKSAGGSVRRSKSMQAPALEYAAVKRKKSLGLNTSLVDLGSSPDIDVDWKVGSAFGGATTSWLGNK
ncbi:hypothetical protein BDA99DRAFT_522244 [Phascolomyces articulosus]|uniref:Uncharacterized protein n=1 Tax=Phascolomyces articulosus TaxID=60185 RepID=A0AAD5JRV7_9FUNG|nr:hypothetical protein BDA99DRAFT_522244 [Phascolomyces articulosus]